MTPNERDFPPGHPASSDYDPESPEAIEWARINVHPKGQRDWPVDHPAAVDTAGSKNTVVILPGVDPAHPELEPFTGRTPAQAEAARKAYLARLPQAKETPPREPIEAPPPPPAPIVGKPSGQPSDAPGTGRNFF